MSNERLANSSRYNSEFDDEIDFLWLIKAFLQGWKIWISTVALAILSAYIYNNQATPIYRAQTTFFVPASGTNNLLGGYASLLGTNMPTNIGDQLTAIAASQRLQLQVANAIAKQYPDNFILFKKKCKTPQTQEQYIALFSSQELRLSKKLTSIKNKTGLFSLTYEYKNPSIALAVVQAYLDGLSRLYQELELGSERQFIKILDEPQAEDSPVSPKKMINLVLSTFGGLILGAVASIFSAKIQEKKKNNQFAQTKN